MSRVRGSYLGALQCEVTHERNGAQVQTDAPPDNNGKGEFFSPTDLVAAALPACMMTIIGIIAERHHISLGNPQFSVEKTMSKTQPRRIEQLVVNIELPASLDESTRSLFENGAKTCPVHHSLHPDINVDVTFIYV